MLGGVTGLDGGADTDGFGAKLRFRERVGVFESQGWTNESNGSLNTKYIFLVLFFIFLLAFFNFLLYFIII